MSRNYFRAGIVGGSLLFTLSLHYMLFPMPSWAHMALHETDLHRRLCYIPIILGALWFGLKGGLVTAAVISAAVLPLAVRYAGPLSSNGDFVEICFYFAIGALAGVLVDLKDRERAKKERLERELASAERLAALGHAAAGIAHEIRTPLGSIQGATEILAEDYPDGHPRRAFFDILEEECRRLARVVDDFLDLGRPMTLNLSPADAGSVMESALKAIGPMAEERGLVLNSAQPPQGVMVAIDVHRIHQALVNLLRNAVQASPKGGVVTATYYCDERLLTFKIEDTGGGICPGDEERIFEPFFTKRKDGTGLGLPLARQVALSHGGNLAARNKPDGGAVFTLSLPRGIGERML